MSDMRREPVVSISTASTARARARRHMRDLAAAAQAAATSANPNAPRPAYDTYRTGGRAWLNGHELGGSRYDQLAKAHD